MNSLRILFFGVLSALAPCEGTLFKEVLSHWIKPTDVTPPGNVSPVLAPKYIIDLGLPPQSRWNESLADLLQLRGFDHSLGVYSSFMDELIGTDVANELLPYLENMLDSYFPEELATEVRGIAGVVADLGYGDDLPLSYIILMNLIYEESVFCTSIVGHRADGTIIHGRNLDYGINGLEYTAVELHFTNSSSTSPDAIVFAGNTFLGSVGLLNGVTSKFSVSFDERDWLMGDMYFKDTKRPHIELRDLIGFVHNMMNGKKGGHSSMLLVRETLQSTLSYADALDVFANTPLISPLYFIVGGMRDDEGAVVTRWPNSADIWPLNSTDGAWYRLQTNYDHWKPVPPKDDRRTPGNEHMQAVGPNDFTKETLWNVLSDVPTLNNSTKYTSIMCASEGAFINTTSWLYLGA